MSRRRRTAIIILCGLPAAVLLWLDHSPIKRKWHPQPNDSVKYSDKAFTVANVVDGDTLDIDVPDGRLEHTRIRLLGIDAPEIKGGQHDQMYFGREAHEFAEKLTLGKQVTVYLDAQNRTRDNYGRLLAYVKLPDGSFLNEVLVAEGLAYADLRFPHIFSNKYNQLEANARSLKAGLWEKVTRQQLPEWLQRKRPNLLNK